VEFRRDFRQLSTLIRQVALLREAFEPPKIVSPARALGLSLPSLLDNPPLTGLHKPVYHSQISLIMYSLRKCRLIVSTSYILATMQENRDSSHCNKQESRAVARKPRDAAAVLFRLKFADNIHYKFKSNQASKSTLQSSKHTGEKQNLMQNGHSRSFLYLNWWSA